MLLSLKIKMKLKWKLADDDDIKVEVAVAKTEADKDVSDVEVVDNNDNIVVEHEKDDDGHPQTHPKKHKVCFILEEREAYSKPGKVKMIPKPKKK